MLLRSRSAREGSEGLQLPSLATENRRGAESSERRKHEAQELLQSSPSVRVRNCWGSWFLVPGECVTGLRALLQGQGGKHLLGFRGVNRSFPSPALCWGRLHAPGRVWESLCQLRTPQHRGGGSEGAQGESCSLRELLLDVGPPGASPLGGQKLLL